MLEPNKFYKINDKKMRYIANECGKYILVHEGNIVIMRPDEIIRYSPWKDSVKIDQFCNLYPSGQITTHATKDAADNAATPNRVARFEMHFDSANPAPMRVM